jgi:putative phosphoesterase
MPDAPRRIGLISDTHGLLRPEALAALSGCEHIIHAGDIGTPEVLRALEQIAPVTAVRGNNDRAQWAKDIAETEVAQLGDTLVYVLHDLHEIDVDPAAAGFHVVISGHSHQPAVERRGGVLFVNPGSAGPRRFSLPVTVAILNLAGAKIDARIIDLAADR